MSKYHKKVLRKQGECIFGNEKPISFLGPLRAGPGPPSQLVLASLTQLRFAMSAIYTKRNLDPPLNQILDPLLDSASLCWEIFSKIILAPPLTKILGPPLILVEYTNIWGEFLPPQINMVHSTNCLGLFYQ